MATTTTITLKDMDEIMILRDILDFWEEQAEADLGKAIATKITIERQITLVHDIRGDIMKNMKNV